MNPMDVVTTTLAALLSGVTSSTSTLSIDTQGPVRSDISCKDSLTNACSFEVAGEPCASKRKSELEALKEIEAVIKQHSDSGNFISLENKRCAGRIVGVLPASSDEAGLSQSLTNALAVPGKNLPVLLFPEGVTMDEVLKRWRETQPSR